MKRIQTNKKLIAGAALMGILSGGFVTGAVASQAGNSGKTQVSSAGTLADEKKGDSHECKGHNSCKGKGGCKSGDNGCAGKNSCKGKGGCAVKDGKPIHGGH